MNIRLFYSEKKNDLSKIVNVREINILLRKFFRNGFVFEVFVIELLNLLLFNFIKYGIIFL